MDYYIYELKFITPVHIGTGKLSSTDNVINADTIFSALCIQQNKMFGEDTVEEIVNWAKEGNFLISDAMPYIDKNKDNKKEKNLYIRKPLLDKLDSNEKDNMLDNIKKIKKIKFINIKSAEKYVKDTVDFIDNIEENKELDEIKSIKTKIQTMSSSRDMEKLKTGDMLPFKVATLNFEETTGLYIIVGLNNNIKGIKVKFEKLLDSLGRVGIGGKKSSGLGKFEVIKPKEKSDLKLTVKNDNNKDYNRFISLSTCMAKQEEIDTINGKAYKIIKRSGFIDSATYAHNYMKKENFYAFESGSIFEEKFEGDVFIVENNGKHNVYRYAKPIFLGVKVDE